MTLPNVPEDVNMTPEVRRYLAAVVRELEATAASIGDIAMPTKASSAEAVAGTNDTKFLTPLSGIQTVKTFSPFVQFAYFEDQKAAGNSGGAGSTSYATRTLNTTVYNNIAGVSLSSNEVTLPAGTYMIEASCPASRVDRHKCRLFNVTDTAVIAYGAQSLGAVGSGNIANTRSEVTAVLTITGTKAIRLEHRLESTTNTSDYGNGANMTGVEVYSLMKIWKLT